MQYVVCFIELVEFELGKGEFVMALLHCSNSFLSWQNFLFSVSVLITELSSGRLIKGLI